MVESFDSGRDSMERGEFGERLRALRRHRGVSQLDLSLDAEVSTRHVSFLECGKSRPSRRMVLRLGEALDLPLRQRNALLQAAGFAPCYPERPLTGDDLAPIRHALDQLLSSHEPYPAFVLDRGWRIVRANRPHRRLLGLLLGERQGEGDDPAPRNALDLVFQPGPVRRALGNWPRVARALLHRLRRQRTVAPDDEALAALWRRIQAAPGVADLDRSPPPEDSPLVAMELRLGDRSLRLFSTLASFGTARDVTLEELVIEQFFPADEASRDLLQALAASSEESSGSLALGPQAVP